MSSEKQYWFPLLPIMLLFVAFVVIESESRYRPSSSPITDYSFSYPESYKTGVPSPSEISYGTHKNFKENKGIWAEEDWDWSQQDKDKNTYDHDSFCGYVLWRNPKYIDEKELPYTAVAYHNFSDHHNFDTLREAEVFVEQWCKP
jgi:hypothetical protein